MKREQLFQTAGAVISGAALAVTLGALAPKAQAEKPGQPAPLQGAPTLHGSGNAVQLVVDGKPFLMLGGEVLNSSSSSHEYMAKLWPHMNALHANTVLTPVSRELIEPSKGKFDFSSVDNLILGARSHDLHLVLLWLATWKNGMSSYQPLWAKEDYTRFPRAARQDGTPIQVLSTLAPNNWNADAQTSSAVMRHLREFDQHDHTVLMVQVENNEQ